MYGIASLATLLSCSADPESTPATAAGSPSGWMGASHPGGAGGAGTGETGGAAAMGGNGAGGSGGASTGAGASGGAEATGGAGGAAGSLGTGDEQCEPGYGADVYDPYPNPGATYPIGPASSSLGWVGEDFESYADGVLIEASSNKAAQAHLDVTSGALYARYAGSYRRGWTTTYNFRVLAVARQGGDRVRWTDQVAQYRGYIWNWHASPPATAGLHLFARYQTENDLYVASLRYDGNVTIKRKHCDAYTTLAQTAFGVVDTRTWYTLRFRVVGNTLRFSVDGVELLSVTDDVLSWGTTGIRTDYMDVYLDDWRLVY
ncbi:MAG: hypothetical protein JRI23_16215 [Deltaproteobacteria bacterium]|jgi:hypothetical protein|nr:hypothetical protein [Deltaproteobacteria bacterium]MBW2533316.1 hypothetical protein [Deltaproteobacteria bacterium]